VDFWRKKEKRKQKVLEGEQIEAAGEQSGRRSTALAVASHSRGCADPDNPLRNAVLFPGVITADHDRPFVVGRGGERRPRAIA